MCIFIERKINSDLIMKTQEFVTLARFASLEEAQVIKALLDSVGVESQIMNATAAQVMPYLEGDVSIMVNGADYEKARQMLDAKFDRTEMVIREKK